MAKEAWGSRVGLVLAMAGNAVGFGNFLRFPIQAVQNGGGAFIIPYLVSFVLLGIPLMLVEWSTGRFGGLRGKHSASGIIQTLDNRPIWKYLGVIPLFSNLVIASYYCYMESWTLAYIYHSIAGSFNGLNEQSISQFFTNYLDLHTSTIGLPGEVIFFYLICLALNVWILSKEIHRGIELISKICMPLLIVFGLFLAVKAVCLVPGQNGAIASGLEGLNFLWSPSFDSLADPKVWLAAAGQVFFTMSLGLGCIQCYASYLDERDDIVSESMAAGFLNAFCEIVIGGSLIIPLAIGYFGIDHTLELCQIGGLGLGFRTLPYLFQQWGGWMAVLAGVAFFGLLFGAGITSSLAMASPIVSFLRDNFGFTRRRGSLCFGVICLLLGLPTILFFSQGVFDEYDYWGGTVALYLFATIEMILFSWVVGVDNGWKMIHLGARKPLTKFYKFVLGYVTPIMLLVIFVCAAFKPKNDHWRHDLSAWEFDKTSIVGMLLHKDIGPNNTWFADAWLAEKPGQVQSISESNIVVVDEEGLATIYPLPCEAKLFVATNDVVQVGTPLYQASIVNNVFYIDMARILLVLVLIGLFLLVRVSVLREKKKRTFEKRTFF